MIVPVWFLYVSGFSLVMLAALQIQARPRKKGDGFYQRFVNLGTVWSLCCLGVGIALVTMALGYYTPDFLQPPKRPPTRTSGGGTRR
jgi:hypothetical protein